MSNNKDKIKIYCKLLFLAAILTGIAVYAKSSGIINSMANIEAFEKYVGGFGAKAGIVFFIIQFISVVIAPIPSNISTAAGGTLFGFWPSFFISTIAITMGSMVVFLLARKFGKSLADRFVSPKITSRYGKIIESRQDLLLAILFFLPFFPDDAICFLAGLGSIGWGRFLIIMLLTRPWGVLVASAVGCIKNIMIPWWGWAGIALVLILLFVFISKHREKIEEKLISIFSLKMRKNA